MADGLPRIDTSILEGRRILVDPGHGGYFRGTVGPQGLKESSVNLGVSLYLWGLLREAGAEVFMTRSIDRDFLSETDSSLASDLRTRVTLADSLEPDILISIHHNAQPARDPEKNSVETYYRAGDPASLDLAFAVHRHLMRNLGIDDGEVRQGNYLILRESKVPAILGESSYLTHPPAEKKLKISEVQKLEAEAYFLGILEYFGRGVPKVAQESPTDSIMAQVPTLKFRMWDDGGPGIDPDGVTMRLNGHRVYPVLDVAAQHTTYRPPWDSPNGVYELSLSVRNIRGNTSPIHRTLFVLDFPPQIATIETTPGYLPPRGGVIRVRARLLDSRGLVVRDGTEVTLTTSTTNDVVRTSVANGAVEVPFEVADGVGSLVVRVECDGKRFEKTVSAAPKTETSVHSFFLRDAKTRLPIRGASVVTPDSVIQQGSATGDYFYRFDPSDETAATTSIRAPGYVPLPALPLDSDTLDMEPWFGGLLGGLRFVIDPEGGRPSKSGKGRLGLSGSYANLQVASYLAGFLRAGGSSVFLTRENEEVRTPEDIARITNRYRANLYVEIRHRGEHPDSGLAIKTFYFPGSERGARASENISTAMARRLDRPIRGPFETVTYPLQQTACPAIVVEAPSLSIVEEELRLAESWYRKEQAYGIFIGILGFYEVQDSERVLVIVANDEPANWRVTLDQTWTLVTGPSGEVEFEALPPGPHHVTVHKGSILQESDFTVSPGKRAEIRLSPSR